METIDLEAASVVAGAGGDAAGGAFAGAGGGDDSGFFCSAVRGVVGASAAFAGPPAGGATPSPPVFSGDSEFAWSIVIDILPPAPSSSIVMSLKWLNRVLRRDMWVRDDMRSSSSPSCSASQISLYNESKSIMQSLLVVAMRSVLVCKSISRQLFISDWKCSSGKSLVSTPKGFSSSMAMKFNEYMAKTGTNVMIPHMTLLVTVVDMIMGVNTVSA
mmetsp:Transcript_22508/g.39599  ORF Transcript_22508/g.39599 Transcript_22508/m.39599 type:complete len:216 (+) Transcript_22508:400-1047(+)